MTSFKWNWKIDGFIDEQRYYCSESPIDPLSLPPAKAIIPASDRTYTDTTLEIGKQYYVRISSVSGAIEKVSVEFNLDTYFDKVVSLLRFNNNIIDETGKVWAVQNGTAAYESNQASFNAWSISSVHNANMVFEGDFTIEALVTYKDFTRIYNTLISSGNTSWSNPVSFIMLYGDTAGSQYIPYRRKMTLGVYSSAPLISTTSVFEANVKTHIVFQRRGNTLAVYKAGILEASMAYTSTIHFSVPAGGTSIGLTRWDATSGYGRSLVDAIRITKGIARYSENFTPPLFL